MSTVECKCRVCKQPFMARVVDRERGWARTCSKSCAATLRERGKSKDKRRRSVGLYTEQEPTDKELWEMHQIARIVGDWDSWVIY